MKRRTTRGLSTAALIGALAIICPILATSSADAAPFSPGYPKTGPHVGQGLSLLVDDESYGTYLYDVDTGDGQEHLIAYCVDFHNSYHPDVPLQEAPWSDLASLTPNGAYISWAMHHSYPHLALTEVESTTGLAFNDGLSDAEAIAATQAAVWLFSDGITLDGAHVQGTPAEQADVAAMYGYLTGPTNTGMQPEPDPTLDLKIDTTVGLAGTPIGPITVTTTGESVDIDAVGFDGAMLVDADGTPTGTVTNGAEVYLDVPGDATGGAVTVSGTTTATATAQVGRLFTPAVTTTPAATQLLAVAAVKAIDVHAEIPVAWKPRPSAPTPPPPLDVTPPPPAPVTQPVEVPRPTPPMPAPIAAPVQAVAEQPQLAYTGLNATESLAVATGLIVGGIVCAAAGRRRRT
ncbi:TQXA domain-containing protein [Antricoccus suffuscus]|uniref:TQXA domain-containing protein n=1 Tax=Antricoccus suffuscus TaxID=1629062 RepID=A0A2T0ZW23_9ACTN|nr:thioester domain-containing protein [Antricoccus suffuscus]PRZ40565.1 TQXA domain-containing protein [Antricoccus suffuscus]